MNDLLVSVRALKRYKYSKQCLDSLEKNSDLDCDFLLYNDGALNLISGERYADDDEVKKNVEVFLNSKLPNKTVIVKSHNIGGANVKLEILKYAFPRYKYLMMLDNDLVFNKYYIKTIKTLFKQFKNTNTGMIQTSYRHFPNTPIETFKIAKDKENQVVEGFSHRWEQGFWRESWYKIKPFMKQFIKLYNRNDNMYLLKNNYNARKDHLKLKSIYGDVADDYCLECCCKRVGYTGLHTLALRHKTIGEYGQYTLHQWRWEAENFNQIRIYDIGNVDNYIKVKN